MKQRRGSFDCVAVVAALVTNTTVKEFKKERGKCPKRGYTDRDIYLYLANRNMSMGASFNTKDIKNVRINTVLKTTLTLKSARAYVVVKSETFKGFYHVIYWDKKQVWDPNPNVKDGRPRSDYKILYWKPIYNM